MTRRWLYFAHAGDNIHVKIGITDDPKRRMRTLKCRLHFAVLCPPGEAEKFERDLHDVYARQRLAGTEWFVIDAGIRNYIANVLSERPWLEAIYA